MVLSADVSRHDDVARALAEVRAAMPPLRGIIHTAGVLDDVLVRQAEWSQFETVLGPKAVGAWHLHVLTAADRLDFFVLYSSTASLLGGAGQANYAAANAFLDGLAHHRRALGLPGTSVGWGAWSTVGMAARLAAGSQRRIGRRGVRLIDPADGAALLPSLLTASAAQVGVVPISWARVAEESGDGLRRPFLELMAAEVTSAPVTATTRRFVDELATTAEAERVGLVRHHVRAAIAAVLGLAADGVGDDVEFSELGMDSLMAVELRNRLQSSLGRALPSTIAFDHPTPGDLSAHLGTLVLEPVATPEATLEEDDDLATMSDAEAESAFAEELAAMKAVLGRKRTGDG